MLAIIVLAVVAIVALTVAQLRRARPVFPVAAGGHRHPGLDQVPAAPLPPVVPVPGIRRLRPPLTPDVSAEALCAKIHKPLPRRRALTHEQCGRA